MNSIFILREHRHRIQKTLWEYNEQTGYLTLKGSDILYQTLLSNWITPYHKYYYQYKILTQSEAFIEIL